MGANARMAYLGHGRPLGCQGHDPVPICLAFLRPRLPRRCKFNGWYARVAKDRLAPSGYVEVHGELWQAEVMEGAPPVQSGESIRVRGIRGLTLIVQPDK